MTTDGVAGGAERGTAIEWAIGGLGSPETEPEPAAAPRPRRADVPARSRAEDLAVGPRAEAVARASRVVGARISPRQVVIRPRAHPADGAPPLDAPSVIVGAALAVILVLELYLAVYVVAIGAGNVLLAVGLALDAGARSLGAVAAVRCGRLDWAALCVLVGSPSVVSFALLQSNGPVKVDPAPLAGLLSLIAIGLVAVAILAALLGI
jgi:hypothetical protein